ncbi:hypothetical protein KUTeg_023880 [Tegillarca granosa]|uniref:Uncharacterized protein n=1 Tax=Tegillarca granosa TaxID=220873 RepID=A0ABQ9E8I6_TEGGR|nr:hypothetical protein KUTeg_023880 [Tegillarca granosa]
MESSVVKGLRELVCRVSLDGCTPCTDGHITSTGWSNKQIFQKYLKEHFINTRLELLYVHFKLCILILTFNDILPVFEEFIVPHAPTLVVMSSIAISPRKLDPRIPSNTN